MIEIRELRLGNIIEFQPFSDERGYYHAISSIHEDDTVRFMNGKESVGCYHVELINPVHLTEKWLLRLGFEWDEITYSIGNIWLAECENGYNVWLHGLSMGITTRVKHVHQLQNLYFALTGTELTYKP
jgi:hypothetical protein